MDVDRRLQDFTRKVDQFDMQTNQAPDGADLTGAHHRVKIALSLYKVQQNIYLLDFQRLDVRSGLLLLMLLVFIVMLIFTVKIEFMIDIIFIRLFIYVIHTIYIILCISYHLFRATPSVS